MKEKPTGKEKTEDSHPYKIADKKKYYWCLHHNNEQGQWVRHHPDECHHTNPTKRKIKKSMTKPSWLHLSTQNTVKMEKNDGYARVA